MSLRSLNVAVFEYLVKTLSVLCGVNVVGVGTENRDSEVVKRFCELYSGLTAELNYCAVGFSASTILVTYSGVKGSK